jgi:hypothetical protein
VVVSTIHCGGYLVWDAIGEKKADRGSITRARIDIDPTAVMLHKPVDHRETESSTLVIGPEGKEGFEDLPLLLLADSLSRIADVHDGIPPINGG